MAEPARVLLVEDNEDDLELFLRELRRAGLEASVAHVSDGVHALQYLLGDERHGPQPMPTAVLLDLHLPWMGGLEVLARLRAHERTKDLPVVILLGSAVAGEGERGFQLGASGSLVKPVTVGALREVLAGLGVHLAD